MTPPSMSSGGANQRGSRGLGGGGSGGSAGASKKDTGNCCRTSAVFQRARLRALCSIDEPGDTAGDRLIVSDHGLVPVDRDHRGAVDPDRVALVAIAVSFSATRRRFSIS